MADATPAATDPIAAPADEQATDADPPSAPLADPVEAVEASPAAPVAPAAAEDDSTPAEAPTAGNESGDAGPESGAPAEDGGAEGADVAPMDAATTNNGASGADGEDGDGDGDGDDDDDDGDDEVGGSNATSTSAAAAAAAAATDSSADSGPRTVVQEAWAAVERDRFNVGAWTTLIMDAQTRDIRDVRNVYERALAVFPTSGRYWKYYVEHELRAKNYKNVEQIFLRCLTSTPHIDLWNSYLSYVVATKRALADGYVLVLQAFEFALEHVGFDISSSQIWSLYIAHIKAREATTANDIAQRNQDVRRAYQKAIATPMHNIETLWRDYDTFENSLANKQLAKAVLQEQSQHYITARAVYRKQRPLMDGINRNMLPLPPEHKDAKNISQQVWHWKRVVEFLKANPHHLDPDGLLTYVMFAYNQALLTLYYCGDVWFEACSFLMEAGKPALAAEMFQRAVTALPDNLLLCFVHADFEEARQNMQRAKALYEEMLARRESPMVFIQYMRFARRALGVDAARTVFRRARNSPTCTHHVFVAAALIEYHHTKDPQIVARVFELGLKRYLTTPAYVTQYLDYLLHLNDENNTRVLFERALNAIPGDEAREVWRQLLSFETTCGDLQSMIKAEARRAAVDDTFNPRNLSSLLHRYRFVDLWPLPPQAMTALTRNERVLTDARAPDKTVNPRRKAAQQLPRPALDQMMMFNPAGGVSSNLPSFLADLVSRLPEPPRFEAPVINVSVLLEAISSSTIKPVKMKESKKGKKRKHGDDGEVDPSGFASARPDVYRARLQRKIQKLD